MEFLLIHSQIHAHHKQITNQKKRIQKLHFIVHLIDLQLNEVTIEKYLQRNEFHVYN